MWHTGFLQMWSTGFSCCISLAWVSCLVACGIWRPWPGMEPTSPALESRFPTTGPPGKSLYSFECIWLVTFSEMIPKRIHSWPVINIYKLLLLSEHTVHHWRLERNRADCIHSLKKLAVLNANPETIIFMKEIEPLASVPYNLCVKRKGEWAVSKNHWLFKNIMASAEQTKLRRNKTMDYVSFWLSTGFDYPQCNFKWLLNHHVP